MTDVKITSRDQELIERIEYLMANPPEGSVILELTPSVCKYIIANLRGTHNRHEKPAAIKRYQIAMETSRWMLNGSTIVFTDQHLLGDGQNRVMGCIRANKAFKTHVIFGVPHEYFYTIDQGRVRNPADILHIEGVPNSSVVYPAVRWAELFATGKVKARTTFNPEDILMLYRTKHKEVEDFLPEARRIAALNRQPISLVAALLYTFTKIDADFAAEFSDAWAAGTYEPRFQSIGTMQAELLRLSNLGSGRIHDVVRAAMIVNAWNVCRSGKTRGTIRWTRDQLFPTIR